VLVKVLVLVCVGESTGFSLCWWKYWF